VVLQIRQDAAIDAVEFYPAHAASKFRPIYARDGFVSQ
jgi:hypothetical protein